MKMKEIEEKALLFDLIKFIQRSKFDNDAQKLIVVVAKFGEEISRGSQ